MSKVKMKLFQAGSKETYKMNVFFDERESAGQIQTMLASSEADIEVQGWAEFVLSDEKGTLANKDGSVKTEWREGKIKWVTIPHDYSS